MSSITTPLIDLLGHALDLTAQRQGLVTENIANIDTPGYHTRDLDFHAELERALMIEPDNATGTTPFVREVPGLIERPDGNNVNIDLTQALQDPNSTTDDIGNAVTELRNAYDQLTSARTFYGSTVDQLLSTQDFVNNENVQFAQQQNSTVGVDMNVAVTNLTNAAQSRTATLEAAAALNGATLMDYLAGSQR
jgi:flagellar basal-body rod protein FlgB